MLTNIVRAFCLLVDVAVPAAATVAFVRWVRELRARRRQPRLADVIDLDGSVVQRWTV